VGRSPESSVQKVPSNGGKNQTETRIDTVEGMEVLYGMKSSGGRCPRCSGMAWFPVGVGRFCGACGWRVGDPDEAYRSRRHLHPRVRTESDREIDRYLAQDRGVARRDRARGRINIQEAREAEGAEVRLRSILHRLAQDRGVEHEAEQARVQPTYRRKLPPPGRRVPIESRRSLTVKAGAVKLAADAGRKARREAVELARSVAREAKQEVDWFEKPRRNPFIERRIKW